jgi:acyl-homoserine lactone acylase PvdQ
MEQETCETAVATWLNVAFAFAGIDPSLFSKGTYFMRRLSVVCLVAACLFGATLETRRATPATQDAATQSIHISGPKDRVTISRDEPGIPYIEGRNYEDLYFAQSYARPAV